MREKVTRVYLSAAAAAVLWFVIFVVKPLNFWLSMCLGILLLVTAAVTAGGGLLKDDKLRWRAFFAGAISAAVLYGVFFLGNSLSKLILPFSAAQIGSVYDNGTGTAPVLIGLALLLVIGPGEELFWRGYVQRALTEKYGAKAVVLAAVLYAAVHVVTLNFMLVVASLVCGLFWGAVYHREKSLWTVVISHALWDVTVFLLLPFR
jgi:membrane protease YdiL (CAAX protease family)